MSAAARISAMLLLGAVFAVPTEAMKAGWIPGPDDPVIRFANHDWIVKDSRGALVGPGPNVFSPRGASVEHGRLHLRILNRDGRWSSAEVVSKESLGYGTYTFEVATNVARLDPRAVLGLFTWNDAPAFAHREIDIEISRWGDERNMNAQCVVQPYRLSGHTYRFDIPPTGTAARFSFVWKPDEVRCAVEAGLESPGSSGAVAFEHRFTADIPQAGAENARMNLWLMNGMAPAEGREIEVVITNFQFTPLRPS